MFKKCDKTEANSKNRTENGNTVTRGVNGMMVSETNEESKRNRKEENAERWGRKGSNLMQQ